MIWMRLGIVTCNTYLDKKECLVLVFSHDRSLIMGLRDEDYNGPEALSIRFPDRTIVVWD